jgi:DNA mismatch endonuclease (patch repair protein)
LSKARIAVFVDGCFWHGCAEHGVLPKNNRDWWRTKLETNRERDARKDAELAELGWVALHFWEHEAVPDMVTVVTQRWRERTGRAGPPRSAADR